MRRRGETTCETRAAGQGLSRFTPISAILLVGVALVGVVWLATSAHLRGGGSTPRAPAAASASAARPQTQAPCASRTSPDTLLMSGSVALARLDCSAFCESQSEVAAEFALRLQAHVDALSRTLDPIPLVPRARPRENRGASSGAGRYPLANPFVTSGSEPLPILLLPNPASVGATLRSAAPEITDQSSADDVADAVAGSSVLLTFVPLESPPRLDIAIPSPIGSPILPQVVERSSVWNAMGRLVITDQTGAGRGSLRAEEGRAISRSGITAAERCVVVPVGPRTVLFGCTPRSTVTQMRVGYVLEDGVGARRDSGAVSPHLRASGESSYTVPFRRVDADAAGERANLGPSPLAGIASVRRLPAANPVEGTARFLPGERIVVDDSIAVCSGFVALALAPDSLPGAHSFLVIDRIEDLAPYRDTLWLVSVCETIDDAQLNALLRTLFAGS